MAIAINHYAKNDLILQLQAKFIPPILCELLSSRQNKHESTELLWRISQHW